MESKTKIGICQWSVPIDGPYACKVVSELGLEGIQLDIGELERDFPLSKKSVQQAFLECAAKYGISFMSMAVRLLDDLGMTRPENSSEREIVTSAIVKAIDAAEIMGIPIVMLGSFNDGDIRDEDDFRRTVSCLRYACEYAHDKGITIATENLLSTDEIFELFEQVDRSNLKLYFDTQNYYLRRGFDTPKMLEALLPLVCQIHVKDGSDGQMSGALLGEGESSFYQSIEVIKKQKYSGWIVIENYYDRRPLSKQSYDPLELLKQDIEILNQALK